MPRDILSDSLAVLKIVEHDEENWPLEDKRNRRSSKKLSDSQLSGLQDFSKNDCACYFNYGLGDGRQDLTYQNKTNSLPAASVLSRAWVKEPITSAASIPPEDIANQLTLLDLPSLQAIQPEELTTCGWNKLNKLTVAPNVVAFIKRFNRVSFWTVQEVLNGRGPRERADVLAHFIKAGRRLLELNNLHSLFAVVSALQSASVYRLTKTWACLSKKDRQQFDKLAELLSENENWSALRDFLNNAALPCIPYLGIFLTDLVYIDIAHPAGSPHRTHKMAAVLKALERFQTSQYDIPELPDVANFLNSVRYIEELQKFLEDDQYKLSLKLEPPSPAGSCGGSKESVKEVGAPNATTPFSLSPSHRLCSGSLKLHSSNSQSKFIPSHRKCRSLGSNIFGKCYTEERADDKTPAGSVNLLDDTLLESPTSPLDDKLSLSLPQGAAAAAASSAPPCEFEGCVRRKTLLKEGRKPSLCAWQRYWLQLDGEALTFYAAKSFKGSGRGDFRAEHCKRLPLEGWAAAPLAGADGFQLAHHRAGTLYKFKAGTEVKAKQWVAKIEHVTNKTVTPLPANLMSFE